MVAQSYNSTTQEADAGSPLQVWGHRNEQTYCWWHVRLVRCGKWYGVLQRLKNGMAQQLHYHIHIKQAESVCWRHLYCLDHFSSGHSSQKVRGKQCGYTQVDEG